MNQEVQRAVGLTRSVVAAVRSEDVTFVAASLAYYAFVSLLPLLLLGLVVASLLGGAPLADRLAAQAAAALGPEVGELVRDALTNVTGRGVATVFGLGVLLWSALKVFRGMDVAFSQVYGTHAADSLLEQVGDALVVLVAVGFGVAMTVLVGALLSLSDARLPVVGVDLLAVAGNLLLVAALTLTLLPLYYFLPDAGLSVRDALPGAAFAAVGWTLLQVGFRMYARSAGNYEAYGVIGGALLLVTLLYFGGIVLLMGVVLNAVLDGSIAPQAATLGIDEDDLEQAIPHDTALMPDDEPAGTTGPRDERGGQRGVDELEAESLEAEIEELRAELEARTKNREDLESDLRRYVRRKVRRGKARGWGPYLVLLYGTAMTLGAFYFLEGLWAVLAMFVVWTSTLGLYVLMLLVGTGLSVAGVPGRVRDAIQERR